MITYRLKFFFFFHFFDDPRFSLYPHKKLKLIFVLLLYLTIVSLMSCDGPDEALMYFVLHSTGVAQRKRARLITLRTPDRNGSPVLFQFGCFTEATRLASDVKRSQTHSSPGWRSGSA